MNIAANQVMNGGFPPFCEVIQLWAIDIPIPISPRKGGNISGKRSGMW